MCVFCEPEKELILFESKYCVLLANAFPLGRMALLVIPKRHICSMIELNQEEITEMMSLVLLADANMKKKICPEGVNLFLNEGEIAGQTVPHLHFHIVARIENDGLENFKRLGERKVITDKQLAEAKALF